MSPMYNVVLSPNGTAMIANDLELKVNIGRPFVT